MAVVLQRLLVHWPSKTQPSRYAYKSSAMRSTLTAIQSPGLEQYAMRAFAEALDAVPMALAENSGLSPIETLANIKSRQAKEQNSRLGVDCMQTGSNGKCPVLLYFISVLGYGTSGPFVPTPSASPNTNSTKWAVVFYLAFCFLQSGFLLALRFSPGHTANNANADVSSFPTTSPTPRLSLLSSHVAPSPLGAVDLPARREEARPWAHCANIPCVTDMKEHFVIDPLISKRQQLLLATQLCRMVLKVCFQTVHYIAAVLYSIYALHENSLLPLPLAQTSVSTMGNRANICTFQVTHHGQRTRRRPIGK
jgi:hypothetical protein